MTAKILIVDDDKGVRESLEELLRTEEYQADSAGAGDVALEALSGEKYDLVLLDIRMAAINANDKMMFRFMG